MRTFAQKQNQPPVSSSFARSNTAILGPNHHVNPLLHLQRTLGNQAVQRPLRPSGEELKAALNGMASPYFGHDFSRIPIHPPAAPTQMKRATNKSGDDRMSRKVEGKKAELEFHSTIAFNSTTSGSSSIGPSKEGFTFLEIRWVVWNTGWETAPEHVDRLTVYKADRCSGCRDEKDEILSVEVTAPATAPITQPGEGEFRYESITPMVGMTMRAGHYDVYVDLDVYDEVEETNEDNNTIFTSFFVKPRDKSEPDTDGEEEIIQRSTPISSSKS